MSEQLYVVVNKKSGAVYAFDNHDAALKCRRDLKLDSNHLWGCVVFSGWEGGQPVRYQPSQVRE